ncbi:hypothetical protein LA733_1354 [Leptospira interrogans]|nr:hypothetical protein LA733_1354 [Leptospira interrogans]KWV28125.1 hypothetical protein LA702_1192 [Leptospira interrogans]
MKTLFSLKVNFFVKKIDVGTTTIMDLQLDFVNCGNYYEIQKNHRLIRFLHKTVVLGSSSKFKFVLTRVQLRKTFLKV